MELTAYLSTQLLLQIRLDKQGIQEDYDDQGEAEYVDYNQYHDFDQCPRVSEDIHLKAGISSFNEDFNIKDFF